MRCLPGYRPPRRGAAMGPAPDVRATARPLTEPSAPWAQLTSRLAVAQGTGGGGVVGHDGLRVARRLGDPDRARDRRAQHPVAEVTAHLVGDGRREPGAAVVHGQQHGADPQPRVEVGAHQLDRLQQLTHALEGVVLGLDRQQQLLGRHQRVQRQQPQGRRAVDEHVVEAVLAVTGHPVPAEDRLAEPVLAGHDADQLDLGAGQVDGGRHDHEAGQLLAGLGHLRQRHAVHQGVVRRQRAAGVLHREGGGGVALGVEVDHQHAQAALGQAGGDVDRGGRLADAALLVGHHHDARAVGPGERLTGQQPATQLELLRDRGRQRSGLRPGLLGRRLGGDRRRFTWNQLGSARGLAAPGRPPARAGSGAVARRRLRRFTWNSRRPATRRRQRVRAAGGGEDVSE